MPERFILVRVDSGSSTFVRTGTGMRSACHPNKMASLGPLCTWTETKKQYNNMFSYILVWNSKQCAKRDSVYYDIQE